MKNLVFAFLFYSLTANSAPIKMELQNFLSQTKKNDSNIESIIADRLKSRYYVDMSLPSRQTLLEIRNEYGFTRGEPGTTIMSAVLSKPILETGSKLTLGRTVTDRPDREEEITELRIEQALWRNAFGSQIRKQITNLDLERSVMELQVIEAYEDYIEQVIHSYLDLTSSYLNYSTAQRLHQESVLLLNNVQRRMKRNIASSTDLNRARLQVALRKENELQSKVNLETQSQAILRMTGLEYGSIVIPETTLEMGNGLENMDIGISQFLSSSRSRKIYDKQEIVALANLDFEKQNLKPAANLLVGFNIDKSSRFGTTINREEAVVGVNIQIPFGDTSTQAQIKEASYLLLKSKLARKSFNAAIEESLHVIKNKILRQREQVAISKSKKVLAAEIVKSEEKRYQTGRVQLENLIEDRNNLAQYEFAYLTDLTVLNKLIVQWLSLTDQLIDKNEKIKLKS